MEKICLYSKLNLFKKRGQMFFKNIEDAIQFQKLLDEQNFIYSNYNCFGGWLFVVVYFELPCLKEIPQSCFTNFSFN